MNTLEAIRTRKSVRTFSQRPVPDEALRTVLEAGMSGPSAVNARPWSFLVVRDRETLGQMADANGRPAQPLRGAGAGILICGDLERAFPIAPDYWVVDGAIAGQNMLLAAHELGLGAVWLGTWPQMERVEALRTLFGLPETVVPHSVLALGWPEDGTQFPAREHYEPERVHWEKW